MADLSAEDQEMIQEFLAESEQNLSHLDQDLLKLEEHPQDAGLVVNIFRTIHTIKGACGFLGFPVLEGITVKAECLLGQIRDGNRALSAEHISLVRETAVVTRKILESIKATWGEGSDRFESLSERLQAATL